MQILFVADPLESFKTYKDSTFTMMREAQRRGHRLLACEPRDLRWVAGGRVTAQAREIALTEEAQGSGQHSDEGWFSTVAVHPAFELCEADAVVMRKDPPFDSEYFYATHLLGQAERHACARFAEYGRRRRGVGDEIARMTVESNLPMLLRYTDRMSMRFGLEVRSPYLDYRVVQAGLSAPIDSLIAGGRTKMILRKAFAGHLPDDVCSRPKYAGFGNGEEVLFMNVDYRRIWDEIPSWMNDVIDVENLRRTIDRKQARFSTWWALSALIWASTSFSARRA